MYIFFPH